MSRPLGAVIGGLVTGLLAVTAPTPAGSLRTVRTSATAADATAPLVALVALVAWALLAWLLVVAVASLAARLPGLTGRIAHAVGRRIAPQAVRRLVEATLGLTVAAGVLGTTSAALASPAVPPAPPGAVASLDWPAPPAVDGNPAAPAATEVPAPVLAPIADPAVTPETIPAASPPPIAASSTARVRPGAAPAAVVVHPGDSLWSVAADSLPPSASAAQIAQAWPAWWAANREAVGTNPDLIQPGLSLTPPAQS